jgi:hypothetical protein
MNSYRRNQFTQAILLDARWYSMESVIISDRVADYFYQQVIDNDQKNSLNAKSDNSSDIKVDLVEQGIPKLSYFDSSDAHDTNVKGNHANLAFHVDNIVMNNDNDINKFNKDSFIAKDFLLKLTMKNYHPTLHSAHMMLYSIP